MRKPSKKPINQIRIAEERMGILFQQAEKEVRNHPERSRRYIELARKIGMRYNVRLSSIQKMKICRKCNSYLIAGFNCKVRTDKENIITTCGFCNSVSRRPYKGEKS